MEAFDDDRFHAPFRKKRENLQIWDVSAVKFRQSLLGPTGVKNKAAHERSRNVTVFFQSVTTAQPLISIRIEIQLL